MAIIDFANVWKKVVDHINSGNKGSGLRSDRFLNADDADRIVRDFLNDLEAAFAREYEIRFSPLPYPLTGLISESRVLRYETPDGFDYIISFGGSDGELNRQSLLIKSGKRKGSRTGRGIRNIISLFDKGIRPNKYRKNGVWESRSRGRDIYTKTRNYMEGLAVISDFIEDFKRNNEQFGITAKLIAPGEYYARS